MFGLFKKGNKKEMGVFTSAKQRNKQANKELQKFVRIDNAKYHYDPGKELSKEASDAFVESRAQAMSRHFRAVYSLLDRHNLLSEEGKEMKQELDADIYCDGTLNSDMIQGIDANALNEIYTQALEYADYTESGNEKFIMALSEKLQAMLGA